MSSVKRYMPLILTASVLLVLFLLLSRYTGEERSNKEEVVHNNPLYSSYSFDHKDTVHFGIQPLWIPTSAIIEVMKRDRILLKKLSRRKYRIKWYSFLKGKDVNRFIISGDLDAGIGGDMPALTAASVSDLRIVSLFQYGYCSIISRDILNINMLAGKRIGYAPGSNAHFFLLNSLGISGIPLSEVEMVPMDVNHMVDRLISKDIDAFSAWEPTPAIALQRSPGLTVTTRGITYGFLYFTGKFFSKQRDLAGYIVFAEIRAIRWLGKSKINRLKASVWALEASEKFIKRKVGISKEKYSRLIGEDIVSFMDSPAIRVNMLEKGSNLHSEFLQLKKLNLIPGHIKWDNVRNKFDTSIVRDILLRDFSNK